MHLCNGIFVTGKSFDKYNHPAESRKIKDWLAFGLAQKITAFNCSFNYHQF